MDEIYRRPAMEVMKLHYQGVGTLDDATCPLSATPSPYYFPPGICALYDSHMPLCCLFDVLITCSPAGITLFCIGFFTHLSPRQSYHCKIVGGKTFWNERFALRIPGFSSSLSKLDRMKTSVSFYTPHTWIFCIGEIVRSLLVSSSILWTWSEFLGWRLEGTGLLEPPNSRHRKVFSFSSSDWYLPADSRSSIANKQTGFTVSGAVMAFACRVLIPFSQTKMCRSSSSCLYNWILCPSWV